MLLHHLFAAILLEFVQQKIKYFIDQKQFGREKYFFAEETLYYPGADCEDRTVLLAKLIRRYTKLKSIGLLYKEHVSLAVALGDIQGSKQFIYKNINYYNCDPTYLGAKCGEVMPQLRNITPEFVIYSPL